MELSFLENVCKLWTEYFHSAAVIVLSSGTVPTCTLTLSCNFSNIKEINNSIVKPEPQLKTFRSLVRIVMAHALKGQFTHNPHTLLFHNERHFTGGAGDVSQPFNLFHGAKEFNPVETFS